MRDSDRRLSEALHEAGLKRLAAQAERGEFNDFFGLYATPKVELAKRLFPHSILNAAARDVLRRLRRTHDFASGKAEADEWARSEEAKGLFDELAGF